jgi:hypothetical protein
VADSPERNVIRIIATPTLEQGTILHETMEEFVWERGIMIEIRLIDKPLYPMWQNIVKHM